MEGYYLTISRVRQPLLCFLLKTHWLEQDSSGTWLWPLVTVACVKVWELNYKSSRPYRYRSLLSVMSMNFIFIFHHYLNYQVISVGKMPLLFQNSAMNRARPRSPVWLDVFKVSWIKEQEKTRDFHSCINGIW